MARPRPATKSQADTLLAMKNLIAIGLGAVLALSSAAPAPAHSLKSLEERLHKREKYFQAFNKEVPVFALRDAASRTIS